jgi:glutamate--cysteine ligase
VTSIEIPLSAHSLVSRQEQPLTVCEAEDWIQSSCFTPGPAGRIGLELELLLGSAGDPSLELPFPEDNYRRLFSELRNADVAGSLTLEPGGQLELSSHPEASLPQVIESVHRSLAMLRGRAADLGASLIGAGMDPFREPKRITQAPRYAAMEQYFQPWAPAGSTMMCSTASLQVNIEAGTSDAEIRENWNLLYAVGPTLAATFANSAWIGGRRSGWKSTRLAAWLALDPSRTGVPHLTKQGDPADAYARWALDAPLMMIRRAEGHWRAPAGLTFREWLLMGTSAVPDRPPATLEDLQQHLSTLFPHVRPRGYFEVRYLDAQPGCWWAVPAAVIAALISDRSTADEAMDICAASPKWEEAARFGLENPATATAAVTLLALAADRLRLDPATAALSRRVEDYAEKWTVQGLSPADDHPSAWGKREQGCALEGCVAAMRA